jgi:hypothetical protein
MHTEACRGRGRGWGQDSLTESGPSSTEAGFKQPSLVPDHGVMGERQHDEFVCVVANVAEETASGEGGLDIAHGLRHFAAGAKVWVLPPQWGDGGTNVIVAGHHRGTRGRALARMVVPRRHLTRFRVQAIYSPAVIRALTRPLTELGREHAPAMWTTREEATQSAQRWRDYPLDAWLGDRWHHMVSDPPPQELSRDGHTYYLAHFNAQRAIYSAELPPGEQATSR